MGVRAATLTMPLPREVMPASYNDRRFDIGNSEHIDVKRVRKNIYWDCYTGFSSAKNKGE